jgi:hypothetical protein
MSRYHGNVWYRWTQLHNNTTEDTNWSPIQLDDYTSDSQMYSTWLDNDITIRNNVS